MRNWRIISTLAAVVFAAIAGVLVWKYLNNADSRAQHKTQLVSILVAKQEIARAKIHPSETFEPYAQELESKMEQQFNELSKEVIEVAM